MQIYFDIIEINPPISINCGGCIARIILSSNLDRIKQKISGHF